MSKYLKLPIVLSSLFLFVLINSCSAPSTVITGTWEKENAEQEYENVMVAALTAAETPKAILEQKLAQTLEEEEDVNAIKSVNRIPAGAVENDEQKEKVFQQLKNENVEAILTVSVIDKDTEARYVPGTVVYDPLATAGYYNTFWGYYNYWYPHMAEPGYYSLDKVYYLESNVYDADTEELVWSAQSQTYNPNDLENFAENYSEEIVEQLDDEDIID